MPDKNCYSSLCNLNEVEGTFHFTEKFPILKNYRKFGLGEYFLERKVFYPCLNGRDWQSLGSY